jgi:hypothetical protein
MIPVWLAGLFTKKAIGGFFAKYWKIILLFIMVGLAAFGINLAVNKYTDTVAELGTTRQALAEKTAAYSALDADFSNYRAAMGREIARANDTILGLQRKAVENRREYDELADKFEKHDLAFLARRKPGLVAGVINRGTARVFGILESRTREFATGGTAGGVPAPGAGQPEGD